MAGPTAAHRADAVPAAAAVRAVLDGRPGARLARGELWIDPDVLAGAGLAASPAGVAALARRLGADLAFVSCTGPLGVGAEPDVLCAAVAAVHAAGLACGAVVDGPWQRLTQRDGTETALRRTASAGFAGRVGALARDSEAEVRGWALAGADLIVLADDVAYGGGPLFSPALFERLFVPEYRRLLDATRRRPPLGFHSDGDMSRLLPALLAAGFACFSLEPEATAPGEVWRRFGTGVTLLTGIPAAWLAPAADWSAVATALDELVNGGSVILASTCGVFETAAVERLSTVYRLADRAAAARGAATGTRRAAPGAL